MTLTRRLLVRLGLLSPVGWAVTTVPHSYAAGITSTPVDLRPYEGTLAAWVDTLLPADANFPAASSLGIHRALLADAQLDPRIGSLFRQGLAWGDARAREAGAVSFAAAPAQRQEALVAQAEAADPRAVPNLFFRYSHNRCFTLYYSNPRVWAALGFQGPPQPAGYMDFVSVPPGHGQ